MRVIEMDGMSFVRLLSRRQIFLHGSGQSNQYVRRIRLSDCYPLGILSFHCRNGQLAR